MKPKIFIIDDDKLITTIYADYLSSRGFLVNTSNSSFGVTNLIRSLGSNVVIIDMNIPGLNGRSLCSLLAADENRRVVLVSGEKQEPAMKEIIADGLAHDYFIKGQPLGILDSKISRLI